MQKKISMLMSVPLPFANLPKRKRVNVPKTSGACSASRHPLNLKKLEIIFQHKTDWMLLDKGKDHHKDD